MAVSEKEHSKVALFSSLAEFSRARILETNYRRQLERLCLNLRRSAAAVPELAALLRDRPEAFDPSLFGTPVGSRGAQRRDAPGLHEPSLKEVVTLRDTVSGILATIPRIKGALDRAPDEEESEYLAVFEGRLRSEFPAVLDGLRFGFTCSLLGASGGRPRRVVWFPVLRSVDQVVKYGLFLLLAEPDLFEAVRFCRSCDRPFVRRRADMVYCSAACRVRHFRRLSRGASVPQTPGTPRG